MPNGAWEGEAVWSPVILAQYVIANTIINGSLIEDRHDIITHFRQTRRSPAGWGLYAEAGPHVFATTLAYVSLRLLGVSPDDPLLEPARKWLWSQECSMPIWGKIWLSFLGISLRDALPPLLPELFLLPDWAPGHPRSWYPHTRYIYLALSYLYGAGFRVSLGTLGEDLRRELPIKKDSTPKHRRNSAMSDALLPLSRLAKTVFAFFSFFEKYRRVLPKAQRLRENALNSCFQWMLAEQEATEYQSLSPFIIPLNILVLHHRHHPGVEKCIAAAQHYRWTDAGSGLRYAGARSATWDTAFVMQCALEGFDDLLQFASPLKNAYRALCDMQITEELVGGWSDRQQVLGGWCFGDARHRWPTSDCTAEALCAILLAHQHAQLIPESDRISIERLENAVAFILSRQNRDGRPCDRQGCMVRTFPYARTVDLQRSLCPTWPASDFQHLNRAPVQTAVSD